MKCGPPLSWWAVRPEPLRLTLKLSTRLMAIAPRSTYRTAVWSVSIALLLQGLSGCRAQRDPDMDRRLEQAVRDQAAKDEQGAQPKPEEAAAKSSKKGHPDDPPPKGAVDQRTYDKESVTAVLGAVGGDGDHYVAEVVTERGTMRCDLDHKAAPQTVANFISLALGLRPWRDPDDGEVVKARFYDGLSFHRCITDFIVQTGNPSSVRAGGPGWTIPREPGDPQRFKAAGAMAMVDAGDDSHGSQFFIPLRASKSLEGRSAPFGRCDNVGLGREIAKGEKHPATKKGKSATRPVQPVRVNKVRVLRSAEPVFAGEAAKATGESQPTSPPAQKAP